MRAADSLFIFYIIIIIRRIATIAIIGSTLVIAFLNYLIESGIISRLGKTDFAYVKSLKYENSS